MGLRPENQARRTGYEKQTGQQYPYGPERLQFIGVSDSFAVRVASLAAGAASPRDAP